DHDIEGFAFHTLPEPGPWLATFATVNDVHFGEEVCGVIEGTDIGPTFRSAPGEPPYPEVMNRAAIAEIAAVHPDVVVVKGDLTAHGTDAEYEAYRDAYASAFGDRLVEVRGNHESFHHSRVASEAFQQLALPGVTLVVLDTSVDGATAGTVTTDQLDRLDALAAEADRPVLVFGHHHLGDPDSREKADRTFGIDLDASAAFLATVAGRPAIRGYFAGHTHRNRVRRFAPSGDVAWVEVGCVKDHPGTWAEYRVHEDGIVQIAHRISSPEALAWSERTRTMYNGLYHDYAFGSLADRCFAIPATRT
ncbi:MAG: metallophosphoesterase family protein, partial [Acidimicrobiales bacterium]